MILLKNYGTMEKTMILYRKLWNFDFKWKNYDTMEKTMVLWTKLWYYTENYGTSIYVGKNMVDYQN